MGIGLVTTRDSTIVRLVRSMNMAVLLSIATIREPPLAAIVLASKRFLSWKKKL